MCLPTTVHGRIRSLPIRGGEGQETHRGMGGGGC